MKSKILISIIVGLLTLTSCSGFLDVEPAMSLSEEGAVRTKRDVLNALNGCYDALQRTGYYGRDFVVIGDLPTDNLDATGTIADFRAIDLFNHKADNSIVLNIWAAIYDAINRGNNVLYRIDAVTDMKQEEVNAVKAELLFLRALHYYNLVRLFGDVPYRELPTLNTGEAVHIARTSRTIIYERIIEDLENSLDHLKPTAPRYKANLWAAKALLAKVHLTLASHQESLVNFQKAFDYADDVIENGPFTLSPVYDNLFVQETNPEVIFMVEFNEQDWTRLAQYFAPSVLSGRREFWPTTDLVNQLQSDVVRYNSTIGSLGQGYKFRDIATGTDNVLVIRLADIILTRAEARVNVPTLFDPALIRTDINGIRNRVELEDYIGSNFAVEILNQRRLEFALEGHRWFDLVRTGNATTLLGISENFTLFPIPQAEITNNNKINEQDQNPGY